MSGIDDGILLAARVFLAALFLVFGWRKLTDFPGTVRQMARDGLPMPAAAAAVATFMELPVAFAVAIGAFTRPSALLMALYTLGTSLAEHRFWATTGPEQLDRMEAFFKNLGIMGGFLLLYISGPGRYSIDMASGLAAP
ncbi:MAG TPA: DoxX family protein [Rhizomicrobium sp.]|nr:DoxX family protein [Rhizomicrobium sp.]